MKWHIQVPLVGLLTPRVIAQLPEVPDVGRDREVRPMDVRSATVADLVPGMTLYSGVLTETGVRPVSPAASAANALRSSSL